MWIVARRMKYSREVRERAVALVMECQAEYDSQWEAIRLIAAKVNVSTETLRKWVRQAEVDAGQRPGTSSEESDELKRLRRENAELRRANEILKAASRPRLRLRNSVAPALFPRPRETLLATVSTEGGHRQANAALHRIIIVRTRFHEPTINYVARRTKEGKPSARSCAASNDH